MSNVNAPQTTGAHRRKYSNEKENPVSGTQEFEVIKGVRVQWARDTEKKKTYKLNKVQGKMCWRIL